MNVAELPMISADPCEQSHYERLRLDGMSHNFAEMVALGKAAGSKVVGGNDAFLQNRSNNQDLEKMSPAMREIMLRPAREAGVSVHGKVYASGLARFPNDPQAWVGSTEEIKARCVENNWDCAGAVTHHVPDELADNAALRRAKRAKAQQQKLESKGF